MKRPQERDCGLVRCGLRAWWSLSSEFLGREPEAARIDVLVVELEA